MATQNPGHRNSLYPEVIVSNPDAFAPFLSNQNSNDSHPSSPSSSRPHPPSAPPLSTEEVLIRIPGAILNLIDKQYSLELACGDFTVVRLRQGDNAVAVLARVANEVQWPLAKDETAVKVDDSHYFFSFQIPKGHGNGSDSSDEKDARKGDDLLSYGLTIASKGQESLLKELDKILQDCSNFSVQKVSKSGKKKGEVSDGSLAKEISPADLKSGEDKELMEKRCAAYWTRLAPNVEDYNRKAARMIAAGTGRLIKGILWCSDVTAEGLKRGNEVMKKTITSTTNSEISPKTLERIRKVKRVTKMTEKVANGVQSGVEKVSGSFTRSLVNSKAGKKFFNSLPGEVLRASLDGYSKVCDAVEVAGKNVMSTSATVTTELVNHKYGEQAAEATNEGLGAAGHALGTAWAVSKIVDIVDQIDLAPES